jgi:hypothetical protein
MADNLTISTAGGTITLGTNEISSVHYQRYKLIFGADGVNDGDVSQALPFPVSSALRTDVVQNAGTQLTPKFAVFTLTATGTLVAAVADKKIRVLSLLMTIETLTGDETYTFKTGAAGTALTGALGDASAAGAMLVVEYTFSPLGHFETTSGVLLELSIAGTTPNAQGSFVYVEV